MQTQTVRFSSSHITEVVELLIRVFPEAPSSLLGKDWLVTQYKFLIGNKNFGGYVALQDTKVIGFVCGMQNWDSVWDNLSRLRNTFLITHPYLAIRYLFRAMIRHKNLNRYFPRVSFRYGEPIKSKGTLSERLLHLGLNELSTRLWIIAVDQHYRGTGLADELINLFVEFVKLNNSCFTWLTVDADNQRACKFYEHNHWDFVGTTAKNATIYIKKVG